MLANTTKDRLTGVPVTQLTSGSGIHLLPYYTARCLSHDNRFVCCTRTVEGEAQAWLVDLTTGEGRQVSSVEDGLLIESVAFHPSRPLLFYGSEMAVFSYNLETEETDEVFRCSDRFRVKSEISVGREHAIFWIYEFVNPCADMETFRKLSGFHIVRNAPSYIMALNVQSGGLRVVWGDTAPLTHPVISPVDENVVLYANQGIRELWQELFTIPLQQRDDRRPRKLYHAVEQRPIYVGHSFFTYDGWVGTQLIEFGGRQPDGSYPDMVDYNAIIKPDGECDRRARVPGGNKPIHCHAAYADSWRVGDAFPREGEPSATDALCVMKNNWETGFAQAEPLAIHGGTHQRPFHVHPRFSPDEKRVLYNANRGGDCHVFIAYVEEFLDKWQDRVPFGKRQYRHGNPPVTETGPRLAT